MPYTDLVQWMFNLERFGIKLGLENMSEFLARIGDPHKDFRSVHVTGTNGKGSACAFIASILSEEGMKTGLYTSPHLVDFRERIVVDGEPISEKDVVRLCEGLRTAMESMAKESEEKQLTFFEFTTGLAFKYFSEVGIDIAVVEVGMGGRLDATNLITPEIAAITRIGLEHTAYLGRTVKEIAREKAGIIKEGVPTVSCERDPEALSVIERTCAAKSSPLRLLSRDFSADGIDTGLDGTSFEYHGARRMQGLWIPLIGGHQAENAALAIAVCEELEGRGVFVSDDSVKRGLAKVAWPGRLDVWSRNPLIILDGSHNPDGVTTSTKILESLKLTPITYVVACMNDKDARGIIKALESTAAGMIVTQVDTARSMSAQELGAVAVESYKGNLRIVTDPTNAVQEALENGDGAVCVIGSFYLVGEVIDWLEGKGNLPRRPMEPAGTRKV